MCIQLLFCTLRESFDQYFERYGWPAPLEIWDQWHPGALHKIWWSGRSPATGIGLFHHVVQGHEEKVSTREWLSSVIILQDTLPTSKRVVCPLPPYSRTHPLSWWCGDPINVKRMGALVCLPWRQEFCSIIISGPIGHMTELPEPYPSTYSHDRKVVSAEFICLSPRVKEWRDMTCVKKSS